MITIAHSDVSVIGLNVLPLALTLLLALISIPLSKIRVFVTGNLYSNIPKLQGVPLLGSLPSVLLQGTNAIFDRLAAAASQEGVAYCWVAPTTVLISMTDPELIRQVLKQDETVMFRNVDTCTWNFLSTARRVLGTFPVFYLGDQAKLMRTKIHQHFGSSNALAKWFDLVKRVADKHITSIKSNHNQDSPKNDLHQYTNNFGQDIWGEMLLEKSDIHLDQASPVPVSDKLGELLPSVSHLAKHKVLSILNWRSDTEPDNVEKELKSQLQDVLEVKLEHLNNMTKHTALQKFSHETGGTVDGPLSNIAMDFFKFGILTGYHGIGTGSALALYQIARNPDIIEKLRAEIRNVNSSGKVQDLSLPSIQQRMPYLDAVVKETFRLHPAVPASARIVQKNVTVTSRNGTPIQLKPGTLIYVDFCHMHTDVNLWGEDAFEFKPERWLKSPEEAARLSRYYMPFSGGSRGCVGYSLSVMAMKTFITLLLTDNEIDVEDIGVMDMRYNAFMGPAQPIHFTFTESKTLALEGTASLGVPVL